MGLGFATVMSFSGYLTSMMEEMMIKDEVFAKHSPFMEKIAVHQNRVILKYLYSITPKGKGILDGWVSGSIQSIQGR